MADFGLVGGAYEAPSIYQDAQELINWYCEIDSEKPDAAYYAQLGEEKSRGVVALYPTPGFGAPMVTPEINPVRGMRTLSGGTTLLAVVGSGVYAISPTFTATLAGNLATANGIVSIDDNGTQAMIVDGVNRYSYTIATGAFATIAVGDGPFVGGGIVVDVDNYLVYTRPGTAQFGATNALSTASAALSFASTFSGPYNLVGIIVAARDMYMLTEKGSEAWIDVGSFPFPFQIIPGSSSNTGCVSGFTIARIGETFAFLSQNERGQGVIRQAVGYAMNRISTHAVEQSLLGKYIADAFAYSYQIEGHEFYVITFPTADLTWVFDVTTEKWNKWLSIDADNVYHRHRSSCYALFQGYNLIGDYQNGNIHVLDNTVYLENNSEIRRLRRAVHLVSDFKHVFYEQLQIQFQPGVGLDGIAQGTNPQAMLRWSDDGGSTWSNEHWTSIGKIGRYKNRAMWRRMGQARDRIYEVSITDPVKAVIISADLQAEEGAH